MRHGIHKNEFFALAIELLLQLSYLWDAIVQGGWKGGIIYKRVSILAFELVHGWVKHTAYRG